VFWTSWFDEEFDLAQEEDDEVEVLDSVRDEWDEVIEEEEVDESEFELDVEADNEEVCCLFQYHLQVL